MGFLSQYIMNIKSLSDYGNHNAHRDWSLIGAGISIKNKNIYKDDDFDGYNKYVDDISKPKTKQEKIRIEADAELKETEHLLKILDDVIRRM